MRVLLIGRSPILAKALKRGLEEEGFTVDVAGDDRQEDNKIRTGDSDLIIFDLSHPREAALPLLKRWRRAGLKTPALVLTAPNSNDEPARDLDSEADDWLTKPFALEDLLARVRALVGSAERGGSPRSEVPCATYG